MSLKLNEESLVAQSLEAVPVDEGRNNDKLIMIIMPLWDSFVLFDPFHCFIVRDKVFGLYYVEFPVSLIVTDIRSALALQYVVITSCFVFFFSKRVISCLLLWLCLSTSVWCRFLAIGSSRVVFFIRGRNSPLQSVRCCVVNSSASLMCHVSDCYQLVVVFYGGTQRV